MAAAPAEPTVEEQEERDWNSLPALLVEEINNSFQGQEWLRGRHVSKWWRTALSERVRNIKVFPHAQVLRKRGQARQWVNHLLAAYPNADHVMIATDANCDPDSQHKAEKGVHRAIERNMGETLEVLNANLLKHITADEERRKRFLPPPAAGDSEPPAAAAPATPEIQGASAAAPAGVAEGSSETALARDTPEGNASEAGGTEGDAAAAAVPIREPPPRALSSGLPSFKGGSQPGARTMSGSVPAAALGSGTGGGSAGYSTLSGGFGHSYGYNHNHSHSASMLGERDRGGRTGSKPHPGCVHCSKGFLRLELMCSPSILPFDIEADKAAAEKKAGSGGHKRDSSSGSSGSGSESSDNDEGSEASSRSQESDAEQGEQQVGGTSGGNAAQGGKRKEKQKKGRPRKRKPPFSGAWMDTSTAFAQGLDLGLALPGITQRLTSMDVTLTHPVFPRQLTALSGLLDLKVSLPRAPLVTSQLHFVTALTGLRELRVQANLGMAAEHLVGALAVLPELVVLELDHQGMMPYQATSSMLHACKQLEVLILKNFVLRSVTELSDCPHLVDVLLTLVTSYGAGEAASRTEQCQQLWSTAAQLTGLKSLNVNAWGESAPADQDQHAQVANMLLPIALPQPAGALRNVGGMGATFVPDLPSVGGPINQGPEAAAGAAGTESLRSRAAGCGLLSELPSGLTSLTALGLMLRAEENLTALSSLTNLEELVVSWELNYEHLDAEEADEDEDDSESGGSGSESEGEGEGEDEGWETEEEDNHGTGGQAAGTGNREDSSGVNAPGHESATTQGPGEGPQPTAENLNREFTSLFSRMQHLLTHVLAQGQQPPGGSESQNSSAGASGSSSRGAPGPSSTGTAAGTSGGGPSSTTGAGAVQGLPVSLPPDWQSRLCSLARLPGVQAALTPQVLNTLRPYMASVVPARVFQALLRPLSAAAGQQSTGSAGPSGAGGGATAAPSVAVATLAAASGPPADLINPPEGSAGQVGPAAQHGRDGPALQQQQQEQGAGTNHQEQGLPPEVDQLVQQVLAQLVSAPTMLQDGAPPSQSQQQQPSIQQNSPATVDYSITGDTLQGEHRTAEDSEPAAEAGAGASRPEIPAGSSGGASTGPITAGDRWDGTGDGETGQQHQQENAEAQDKGGDATEKLVYTGPLRVAHTMSRMKVFHMMDNSGSVPVTRPLLSSLGAWWPQLKELYIHGVIKVEVPLDLSCMTNVVLLDLYNVNEKSLFLVDMSLLPPKLQMLGLQNVMVVRSHLADMAKEGLFNINLYHKITWFPSDNGGLTMVPWLATCTKLHSLTLEFDMSSFSRQRSVWTTPVHGLRKIPGLRHLELFFADSGSRTPLHTLDHRLIHDLSALTNLEHLEVWNAYGDDWHKKCDLCPLTRLTRLRQLRMESLLPHMAQPLRRAMQAAVPHCRLRLIVDNEPPVPPPAPDWDLM